MMARGKPWTETELKLLGDMVKKGLNPQQIYNSGKLPERTLHSFVKQFCGSIVITSSKLPVLSYASLTIWAKVDLFSGR
jgi:hypothetical protein